MADIYASIKPPEWGEMLRAYNRKRLEELRRTSYTRQQRLKFAAECAATESDAKVRPLARQ